MTTKQISKTPAKIDRHGWGFYDNKGRELGLNVTTYEADYAPQDDGKHWGFVFEPGHYFVACCQASRDGKNYGAGQDSKHFKTREERDLYICRRLADSIKQAQKKAAS